MSVTFCRQSKAVRSGAKTVPGGLSLPEIMPEYTWYGLALIDLNSLRSASVARAANDGKSTGRKPHLRSPLRRRSSRFHCSSVANPHHAGEAYCRGQQLSPLPQGATLEDEGHAPLAYAEQISMTHMKKLLDQCGRPYRQLWV